MSTTTPTPPLTRFQIYPLEMLDAAHEVINAIYNDENGCDAERAKRVLEVFRDYGGCDEHHANIILKYIEYLYENYESFPLTVETDSYVHMMLETIRRFALIATNIFDSESLNALEIYFVEMPDFHDHDLDVDAEGVVQGDEAIKLIDPFGVNCAHLAGEDSIGAFRDWLRAARFKSNLYPARRLRVGDWSKHQRIVLSHLFSLARIDVGVLEVNPGFLNPGGCRVDTVMTDSSVHPPGPLAVENEMRDVNDVPPNEIQMRHFVELKTRTESYTVPFDSADLSASDKKFLATAMEMWKYMDGKGRGISLADAVGMAKEIAGKQ
ncbi:hypothetical protein P280DRAFT_545170 [Massarina eburnea CBS 473.64]|uniref:Uncharacterized protein n=1 Tax=Massarina eburnea CBS 473.64 TaxID=1395130 RepID=A0A6A6SG66_9PLEO|nr:hypothetical protein P280DRAFT_545170 [Massarina eburnea CBS 473.64]